jgi:retinol dehydrogenase-12
VYIAARSADMAQVAIDALKAETGKESIFFLRLDLANLDSVRAAAEEYNAKESELHTLYNNGYVLYVPLPRNTLLINTTQWHHIRTN